MSSAILSAWDPGTGTAGGAEFAAGLTQLIAERETVAEALAREAALAPELLAAALTGEARLTVPQLARLAGALRQRAIEFLQKTGFLSLDVYAAGLDPLFFLPTGQVRHDARIYMREINPRHQVPERDMLIRNPVLAAAMADELLDAEGKLELELTYLLRTALAGLAPGVVGRSAGPGC